MIATTAGILGVLSSLHAAREWTGEDENIPPAVLRLTYLEVLSNMAILETINLDTDADLPSSDRRYLSVASALSFDALRVFLVEQKSLSSMWAGWARLSDSTCNLKTLNLDTEEPEENQTSLLLEMRRAWVRADALQRLGHVDYAVSKDLRLRARLSNLQRRLKVIARSLQEIPGLKDLAPPTED